MKKFFATILAALMLSSMTVSAGGFAMNRHDAGMLFGKHAVKHVKVVKLDQKVLKQTEGKFTFSILGHNFRFGFHGAHHKFRCCGYRRHFQGNYWRTGVKGSGRPIFRIPWF